MKGWPDILCIVPTKSCGHGVAVGLEVKAGTSQSPEQKEVERYVTEVGRGVYRVVRSLEEVIKLIDELTR